MLLHVQVGPQVTVLSSYARNSDNGLGTSLVARLFTKYKQLKRQRSHSTTLLTNYRCHPSILMLASSLLYESTLLSRSDSQAHPMAPYPIVFACTSFKEDCFANCPPENEADAELLVTKMLEYVSSWPPDPHKGQKPTVALIASTRHQVGKIHGIM